MMRPWFTQHAWMMIVAVALASVPAAGWAERSSAPAAQDGPLPGLGNNTTTPPDGVYFDPDFSSRTALPGGTVHHAFRLVNGDDQRHAIDVAVVAANGTGNDTDNSSAGWTYSYSISGELEDGRLEPGESASVSVVVKAPLLPPPDLYFVLRLSAIEKGESLADAYASTGYLLP